MILFAIFFCGLWGSNGSCKPTFDPPKRRLCIKQIEEKSLLDRSISSNNLYYKVRVFNCLDLGGAYLDFACIPEPDSCTDGITKFPFVRMMNLR